MLDKLRDGFQGAIKKLVGAPSLTEQEIKEFVHDIQRTLLASDVRAQIVLDISKRIEQRALDEKPPLGLSRKDHIIKILYEEFARILGEEGKLDLPTNKTNIILIPPTGTDW